MTVSTPIYSAGKAAPPAAAMVPLLLVFVCGVAVGALTMSMVHHRSQLDYHAQNRELVQKWNRELNLSEAQKGELIGTLDDLNKYYYNVIADGKDRILAILDDGQKQKFNRILHEKRKF